MTILLTLLTLKGCTLSMYNNSQLNHYREICFQQEEAFIATYTDTEVALMIMYNNDILSCSVPHTTYSSLKGFTMLVSKET